MKKSERKIIIPDFHAPGEHLYEDQLGWRKEDREEARSNVSKEIFEYAVIRVGWNLTFYYVDNDRFYQIFGECSPIEMIEPPRDRTEPHILWQSEPCVTPFDWTHLQTFGRDEDVWDDLRIDGKPFNEIMERSYIVELN